MIIQVRGGVLLIDEISIIADSLVSSASTVPTLSRPTIITSRGCSTGSGSPCLDQAWPRQTRRSTKATRPRQNLSSSPRGRGDLYHGHSYRYSRSAM